MFLAACTFALGYALNGGVPNLELSNAADRPAVIRRIEAYYESGRQGDDVARVDGYARAYLASRLKRGVKKPALVLDIDDTSVSTYAYSKSLDFGFNEASFFRAIQKNTLPAIAPTLALDRWAHANGIAVFFVTGRKVKWEAATRSELHALGFVFDGLTVDPLAGAPSVVPFKSGARAAIVAQGYDVLASIGDQWSDLFGCSADRDYKLPNPMYYLP